MRYILVATMDEQYLELRERIFYPIEMCRTRWIPGIFNFGIPCARSSFVLDSCVGDILYPCNSELHRQMGKTELV